MKKQFLSLGYIVVTLLVLCFIMVLYVKPADAEQKSIDLFCFDDPHKIILTLVEYRPGIYTATGTLHLDDEKEIFSIKGTYYEKSGELKATAENPEHLFVVDGYSIRSAAYKTIIHVTIKDPESGKVYFENAVVSTGKPPTEDTATKDKIPSDEVKPEEVKIPMVEGKEPSSPGTREEWNGRWKGQMKVTHAMKGMPPLLRNGEFEMQVSREGLKVRIVEGGKEAVLDVTPSNPNVAIMKREKTEAVPSGGTGVTKETLVLFLRDGRLYMARNILVTATVKGVTSHGTSDAIGIADRVK